MITQAYNMLDSRKTTSLGRLDKKVEEYINLAKGIVNDEMDVEERYNALAGLYKHIDSENGGYVGMLKEEPNDKVDNYLRKQDLDVERRAPESGDSLSKLFDYLKKKESEITLRSTVNGVEHYAYGMNWLPQDGVIPAQVLLFILMEMISRDGEYYWTQVKIRKGKVLPKFWEKKNPVEELKAVLYQQGLEAEAKYKQFVEEMNRGAQETIEEAKQKAREAFPVRFAGVAPDGRPIWVDSEEIQQIQNEKKKQNPSKMIAKGRPTPDTIETGDEQYVSSRLFRYANEIKKRLNMANELQGIEKRKAIYNGLNAILHKILTENEEHIRFCKNLPSEEYTFLSDSCCLEDEELESLNSYVDTILNLQGDEHWDFWGQKINGHYRSIFFVYILANKLRIELEDNRFLLDSAGHCPIQPIAELAVITNTVPPPLPEEEEKEEFPHFDLEVPNDFDFEKSLERMTTGKYLDKKTTAAEWKYACTGEGEEPKGKLNWVGNVNELANMAELFNNEKKIRGGKFATTAKIFTVNGVETNRNNLKSAVNTIWSEDLENLKKALRGLISTQS